MHMRQYGRLEMWSVEKFEETNRRTWLTSIFEFEKVDPIVIEVNCDSDQFVKFKIKKYD